MPGQPLTREYLRKVEDAGGADFLFEQIAQGKTLTALAKHLGVSRQIISGIANGDKQRLKAAREEGASVLAEAGLEIADAATTEDERVARLRIETRRWLASKWDREIYGEQKQPSVTVNLATLHLDALKQLNTRTQPSQTAEPVNAIEA